MSSLISSVTHTLHNAPNAASSFRISARAGLGCLSRSDLFIFGTPGHSLGALADPVLIPGILFINSLLAAAGFPFALSSTRPTAPGHSCTFSSAAWIPACRGRLPCPAIRCQRVLPSGPPRQARQRRWAAAVCLPPPVAVFFRRLARVTVVEDVRACVTRESEADRRIEADRATKRQGERERGGRQRAFQCLVK